MKTISTIVWKDILASTGAGYYTLNINYTISGTDRIRTAN